MIKLKREALARLGQFFRKYARLSLKVQFVGGSVI